MHHCNGDEYSHILLKALLPNDHIILQKRVDNTTKPMRFIDWLKMIA